MPANMQFNYTVNPQKGFNPITKKEENKVWVNFNGLDKKDAMSLQRKGCIWKKDDPTSVQIPIANLSLPNPYVKVQMALEMLGKLGYEIPSLEDIKEDVVNALKDVPTQEEIDNAEKATDDKWIEFMQHVNEEQVQSVLRSLAMGSQRGSNTYGHIYSRHNAISAIAQKPDTTFVATRNDWKVRYGRYVKDNATRIILSTPTGHGRANEKDKSDFVKGGTLGKNRTYKDLSSHEKHFVEVNANLNRATSFVCTVYYDVSDTEPINPNGIDLWADTVGLENNLQGKLNKHAIANQAATMGTSEADAAVIYNNKVGDLEKTTLALAKFIEAKYKKIDIHNINLKNEGAFGVLVEKLADYLMEKDGKIVRPENRSTGIAIIKSIVFALTRLHPDYVVSQLRNNILTMDEYFALRNYIDTIVGGIDKFLPINENRIFVMEHFKTLSSVDELLQMIGVSKEDVMRHEMELKQNEAMAEQKEITNGFNDFYKRLIDNKLWN